MELCVWPIIREQGGVSTPATAAPPCAQVVTVRRSIGLASHALPQNCHAESAAPLALRGGAGGASEWVCACAHLRRRLQDGSPLVTLPAGHVCCGGPD